MVFFARIRLTNGYLYMHAITKMSKIYIHQTSFKNYNKNINVGKIMQRV